MNKFKVNFFPKDQFTSYDFWDITWECNGVLYGSPEVYRVEEEALNMADYYQKNPPINLSEWIKYCILPINNIKRKHEIEAHH